MPENEYKEDISKIFNEINQIINQRFLLTTGAITVFAAIISWLGLKEINQNTNQKFIFFPTLLLLLLLLLLFLYKFFLSRMLSILSAYLIATSKSKWESNFETFRNKKKVGYEVIENSIFFVLGIIAFLSPLVFIEIDKVDFSSWEVIGHIVFGILFLFCSWGMGLLGWFHYKKEALEKHWVASLKKH